MPVIQTSQSCCLGCCSKYLHDVEGSAQETTALFEAIRGGNLEIVRLILTIKGHPMVVQGKTMFYWAAMRGQEILGAVLKSLEPDVYGLLQEMRQLECACGKPSENIRDAARKRCARCCSETLHQAHQFIDQLIAEAKAIEDRSLAPTMIVASLRKKLEFETGIRDVIYAVRNNLYDVVAALIDERRSPKDFKGRKTPDSTAAAHGPGL